MCLIVSGFVASWFVAGALVAPSHRVVGKPPSELNASTFTLESDSGSTIAGWHTKTDSSNGVIVLFHGIRSSRLSMLDRALAFHDAGFSTVMIDLQAHGASTGDAITVGYLEQHDVRAAIEHARKMHPGEKIGVVGVSLGGAATLLATPLDIDAVVLESVYPSIRDAVHNRVSAKLGSMSFVPATLLLIQLQPRLGISPDQLRPIDHMSKLGCPFSSHRVPTICIPRNKKRGPCFRPLSNQRCFGWLMEWDMMIYSNKIRCNTDDELSISSIGICATNHISISHLNSLDSTSS